MKNQEQESKQILKAPKNKEWDIDQRKPKSTLTAKLSRSQFLEILDKVVKPTEKDG